MSAPTEADVNINLNARDNASVQVESAAKRINAQWREMRREQRAVGQAFELNNRTFVATTRVLNQVGSIVGRVQSLYNTYQLTQIRTELATRNLRDAQKAFNETLAEFGPNAKETQDALEALKEAEEAQNRAVQDSIIFWAIAASSLTSIIGKTTTLIGRLRVMERLLKKPPATTPIGTPGPGSTPGPASNIASKIKGFAGKAGKIGGGVGASAALFIAQLAGEQTAAAPTEAGDVAELPSGFEAIGPLIDFLSGKQSSSSQKTIIVNVNSTTSQELVEDIKQAMERGEAFGFGD